MPKAKAATSSFVDRATRDLPAAIRKVDALIEKYKDAPVSANTAANRTREPTEFQRAVWAVCLIVPKGAVTTYGAVAEVVATKGGSPPVRAVGQALKRNPAPPHIPCHRVVASDLKLGGFGGAVGGWLIEQKVQLPKAEGADIDQKVEGGPRRIDQTCVRR